jgi:hypothetical protein
LAIVGPTDRPKDRRFSLVAVFPNQGVFVAATGRRRLARPASADHQFPLA